MLQQRLNVWPALLHTLTPPRGAPEQGTPTPEEAAADAVAGLAESKQGRAAVGG